MFYWPFSRVLHSFFGSVAAFACLYSHEPVFDRFAWNGRRSRDCPNCGSLIRQSGEIRGLDRPVEEFDGRNAGTDECPAAIGRESSGAQRRDLRCSQDHTGGSTISRFAPPRPLRPPWWRGSRLEGSWGWRKWWLGRPAKWSAAREASALFGQQWRSSNTGGLLVQLWAVLLVGWDGQPSVVRHFGPTVARRGCCCVVANCAPPASYGHLSLGGT